MSPRSEQENEVTLFDKRSVTVELNNGTWTLTLFDETGVLLDKFIYDTNCDSSDGIKLPCEKKWLGDNHEFEEGDARLVSNLIWRIVCSVVNA